MVAAAVFLDSDTFYWDDSGDILDHDLRQSGSRGLDAGGVYGLEVSGQTWAADDLQMTG